AAAEIGHEPHGLRPAGEDAHERRRGSRGGGEGDGDGDDEQPAPRPPQPRAAEDVVPVARDVAENEGAERGIELVRHVVTSSKLSRSARCAAWSVAATVPVEI